MTYIGIISKQIKDVKARGRRKRRSTIIMSILEERGERDIYGQSQSGEDLCNNTKKKIQNL